MLTKALDWKEFESKACRTLGVDSLDEITKTRIDLQVKEIKEMRDTVSVLMGAILEDITKIYIPTKNSYLCSMRRDEGIILDQH